MCEYNSLSRAWCVAVLSTTVHGGAWVGKIGAHVMLAFINYSCAMCVVFS
jgi:hypothetical protein